MGELTEGVVFFREMNFFIVVIHDGQAPVAAAQIRHAEILITHVAFA